MRVVVVVCLFMEKMTPYFDTLCMLHVTLYTPRTCTHVSLDLHWKRYEHRLKCTKWKLKHTEMNVSYMIFFVYIYIYIYVQTCTCVCWMSTFLFGRTNRQLRVSTGPRARLWTAWPMTLGCCPQRVNMFGGPSDEKLWVGGLWERVFCKNKIWLEREWDVPEIQINAQEYRGYFIIMFTVFLIKLDPITMDPHNRRAWECGTLVIRQVATWIIRDSKPWLHTVDGRNRRTSWGW